MSRHMLICSASALILGLAAGLTATQPAQALTMKECSAKYQAAKQSGALKGQKWNDFRKAECGGDDDASEAEAAAVAPSDAPPKPAATRSTAARPAAAPPAGSTTRSGRVVFPKSVTDKYSNETPGKARLHTCVDQYNANKANGGNGDLKWIQKGGGYWSQCNTRLKS